VFLGDGSLDRARFRGAPAAFDAMCAACREAPSERLATVAALAAAFGGKNC
jgi:hypothetical protein